MTSSALKAAHGAYSEKRDYGRIPSVLTVPSLIQVQLDSFDTFKTKGLKELFDEISPIRAFGISPWVPPMEPILSQIQLGSAASKAGLQPGDLIKTLNNQPVTLWSEVVTVLRVSPGKQLTLLVQRGPNLLEIPVTLDRKIVNGETIGYLGANVANSVWPADKQVTVQMNPLASIVAGGEKMLQMSWLTLTSIGKLFTGVVSLDNLSGPITIAKVASASASSGIESFINFLAFISVSLGVLNLLPIPMLDGGHLMFYFFEKILGRPLSQKTQESFFRIGLFLLFSLMFFVTFNDLKDLGLF